MQFGLSLSFGNFLAHIVHVEHLELAYQFFQRFLQPCTSMGENDHSLTKSRHGGNGLNAELRRKNLFGLGVAFGEGDVRIRSGQGL